MRNFYDNPEVRQIRSYHGICWVADKPREGRQRNEGSVEGLGLSILLIYDELRDWLLVTRIRNTSPRVRFTGVVCGNVASGGALCTAGHDREDQRPRVGWNINGNHTSRIEPSVSNGTSFFGKRTHFAAMRPELHHTRLLEMPVGYVDSI